MRVRAPQMPCVCAVLMDGNRQGAVPEDYNPDAVILQDQLKKMEKEQKMKEEAAAKAEEERFEALKNELTEEAKEDKVGGEKGEEGPGGTGGVEDTARHAKCEVVRRRGPSVVCLD